MDLLYSQENYFWQGLSGKSLTGKRGPIKITIGFALSYTRAESANAGLYNELGYSQEQIANQFVFSHCEVLAVFDFYYVSILIVGDYKLLANFLLTNNN